MTLHMVSLIMCRDEDLDSLLKTEVDDRFVFIDRKVDKIDPVQEFQNCTGHRLVKTHMSAGLTEKWWKKDKARTVVVLRNPKDTLVSLYHFYKGVVGKS